MNRHSEQRGNAMFKGQQGAAIAAQSSLTSQVGETGPRLSCQEEGGVGGRAHSRPRKCLRKYTVCARKSQLWTLLECGEGCQQAIKNKARASEARQ